MPAVTISYNPALASMSAFQRLERLTGANGLTIVRLAFARPLILTLTLRSRPWHSARAVALLGYSQPASFESLKNHSVIVLLLTCLVVSASFSS